MTVGSRPLQHGHVVAGEEPIAVLVDDTVEPPLPEVHVPLYLTVDCLRNTDAARLGQSFEASGEVHRIAAWRIIVQESLAEVNTQPALYAARG